MQDKKKERVPIWEKYMLTVNEASDYFNIGEKKLRNLISNYRNAEWLLYNGERIMIKRKMFVDFLNETPSI